MFVRCGPHESRLSEMLSQGQLEAVLAGVARLALNCACRSDLVGRALYVPRLDDLVRRTGEQVRADRQTTPMRSVHQQVVVHVATEVYAVGGHTRVIEDIARALPELSHLLVLTDVSRNYELGRLRLDPVAGRLQDAGIETVVLRASTLVGRVTELADMMVTVAPAAIFLMAHHHDVVAFGGIHGGSAPAVVFCHHANYLPSLGATRGDYKHADLGPGSHAFCRDRLSAQPFYLGLTLDADHPAPPPRPARAPMVAATSGRWEKFVGIDQFDYGSLLVAILNSGVDRVHHIGPTPEDGRRALGWLLVAHGHDPRRLVFVPPVPSLAAALAELDPDFYLASHPVTGSKAIVEAMSLGLPVVNPHPTAGSPLTHEDVTLGRALRVRTFEDVPDVVARLERERVALGTEMRSGFEAEYTASRFRKRLLTLIESA